VNEFLQAEMYFSFPMTTINYGIIISIDHIIIVQDNFFRDFLQEWVKNRKIIDMVRIHLADKQLPDKELLQCQEEFGHPPKRHSHSQDDLHAISREWVIKEP
jgi:hypothetical protein